MLKIEWQKERLFRNKKKKKSERGRGEGGHRCCLTLTPGEYSANSCRLNLTGVKLGSVQLDLFGGIVEPVAHGSEGEPILYVFYVYLIKQGVNNLTHIPCSAAAIIYERYSFA